MGLITIKLFPDLSKGMLLGVILALGKQHKIVLINLVCHWIIYPSTLWLFAFHFNMGVKGIWTAQIILEFCLLFFYAGLIHI